MNNIQPFAVHLTHREQFLVRKQYIMSALEKLVLKLILNEPCTVFVFKHNKDDWGDDECSRNLLHCHCLAWKVTNSFSWFSLPNWGVYILDQVILASGGVLLQFCCPGWSLCWRSSPPAATLRIFFFISCTSFSISATILFFSLLITINSSSSLSASWCFSFLFSRHLLDASLLRSRILRNFWAEASFSVRSAVALAEGWGVIERLADGNAGRPLFLNRVKHYSQGVFWK